MAVQVAQSDSDCPIFKRLHMLPRNVRMTACTPATVPSAVVDLKTDTYTGSFAIDLVI